MLTAEHKSFIRSNYRSMTIHNMASTIGKGHSTVRNFMKSEGLTPVSKRDTIGFTCTPPLSCFNCPFADCIKGVTEVKRTELEDIYGALGGIDTVGQGNGRKRV